MSYTPTKAVQDEIEKRKKEDEEAREQAKKDVSARMKKLAGTGGQAPGFSTAQLGAQIAAVTKSAGSDKRNKNGGLSVKAIAKAAGDGGDDDDEDDDVDEDNDK
ncbi:Hypothetical Protein FCC1311_016662 [Hondaea fermentalgiana]|uniref:Uncharacterized protein n=1 Tax=Hondaea fermentalgiana TaxID=2315210 RepID=A0A2R5G6N0_9STRA|nr:Hypothetical Protein FCC1311_016662 [Hondaea fermentalgiana]|eukprot:GBG25448.1 Hypothetical Protein FCC1311_016662 [Hondaea fermentalgiana]